MIQDTGYRIQDTIHNTIQDKGNMTQDTGLSSIQDTGNRTTGHSSIQDTGNRTTVQSIQSSIQIWDFEADCIFVFCLFFKLFV